MSRNVFVLGTDDFNLIKLQSLERANEFRFYKLLDYAEFRGSEHYDIEGLLTTVRARMDAFRGPVHGLVGYFDFPVTDMIPILAREYGLRSASLEAVMKCEHKYWSRLEQSRCVAEHVPGFQAFDPFDDAALAAVALEFPFWIKPIKSFRSFLGFRIGHEEDFHRAIAVIREHILHLAEPFDHLLKYARVPDEVMAVNGAHCLAERIIEGRQCTLEGYVHRGRVVPYGVVDSIREPNRSTFARYEYPSKLPQRVQQRLGAIAERLMSHLGFDNACFNIEFFFQEADDQIWLLEINPRISQSHGDLFQKVDGDSHHQIMVDLAVGLEPEPPRRQGPFNHAAKFMERRFADGVLTRVPTAEELEVIAQRFPGTLLECHVAPGTRLSELLNQDSYSYELADIYMGAQTARDLLENHRRLQEELLHFEIEAV